MMGYLPKISIIIPVYNVEKCLRTGLDSILHQTYTYYEVILVNDGSTDSSATICEEYVERDFRFKLFNQKNSGVAEARNKGISYSDGEYVTFMDSDDWVEKDWLQIYVDAMQQGYSDILVQGIIVDTDHDTRKECAVEAVYDRESLFDGFLYLDKSGIGGFAANKLYRMDLIKTYKLEFRYQLHEDMLFNMEYICYANSLKIISKASYHYVQHDSGSLVTRRYHFSYMMSLNTSLRDARLFMAETFERKEYKKEAWANYIGLYTVLLFSLYDKYRGISKRKERLKVWYAYQQERKEYKDLRLIFPTYGKRCFSHIAMLPPIFIDFMLKTIFAIKERIR